ncbi:6733_t:CDS:2, partial [Dentiscutata erythropus]
MSSIIIQNKRKDSIPVENIEENEQTNKKQKNNNKAIEAYIEIKPFKLSSEVDRYAYKTALPEAEERLNFMRNLLTYYTACVNELDNIENLMPKKRKHHFYFKGKAFKGKTLKGPQVGATIAKSLIKLNKTENKKYTYDIIINSPDSSSESNFTKSLYTIDDGFIVKDAQKNSFSSTYITKQNSTIIENNIFFRDEKLQIDDSDNDSDLITEEEALFNIGLYKNINN